MLAVLLAGGGVIALLVASVVTSVVMLTLARVLAGAAGGEAIVAPGAVAAMARQVLPFGLLMAGFALYYRIDMVMLEWLVGPREVGLYARIVRCCRSA